MDASTVKSPRKIAVIGNAGAGKTTLSRRLAKIYELPLYHVDTYQFLPDLQMRPFKETVEILIPLQEQDSWIIDGFGPLDILEKRFALADQIIFIDFPLWRHYFWATKRQFQSLGSPRSELPKGISELNLQHVLKLYKTIRQVHEKMRPELLRILERPQNREKLLLIRTLPQWNEAAKAPRP